ncbi:MAG TPA: hypothetical protein VEK08_27160 [Planctomycetota bacterium]|nr:hypothetical protein [Planctomycetota bacterium]
MDSSITASLLSNLQHPSEEVRRSAFERIKGMGPEARILSGDLLRLLIGGHDKYAWIGETLFCIGANQDCLPLVLQALKHQEGFVRFWAARTCVASGLALEGAIPALIDSLIDNEIPVMDSAVWALRQMGKPGLKALISTMKVGENGLRRRAALAISRYIDDVEIKIPPLVELLDHDDKLVRITAALAITFLKDGVTRAGKMGNYELDRAAALAWPLILEGAKLKSDAYLESWCNYFKNGSKIDL